MTLRHCFYFRCLTQMLLCVVVFNLSNCVRVPVHASDTSLKNAASEIQQKGFAEVKLEEKGTHTVQSSQEVDVVLEPKSYFWGLRQSQPQQLRLTLGALTENCKPDLVDKKACILDKNLTYIFRVGVKRKPNGPAIANALGIGMGATFFVHCLANCDSSPAAIGIGVATIGLLILYAAAGRAGSAGSALSF